jgi:hypothetical protein
MSTAERLLNLLLLPHLVFFMPVLFFGLPWAAIRIRRWTYRDVASQMFRECKVYAQAEPGLVPFQMRHFSGVLQFIQWYTLQGYASTSDARLILGRILKHNLSCGWLAYLGPLTPFVTLPEYFAQRRRIDEAELKVQVPAIRQQPFVCATPEISGTRKAIGNTLVVLGTIFMGLFLLSLLLRPLILGFSDFVLQFVVMLLAFLTAGAMLFVGQVCRNG